MILPIKINDIQRRVVFLHTWLNSCLEDLMTLFSIERKYLLKGGWGNKGREKIEQFQIKRKQADGALDREFRASMGRGKKLK